jgi:hypothetical protein
MTATLTSTKLKWCLRNKITTICWFLNTKHKTEHNALTNKCISWYDIKDGGIYWNNKYARRKYYWKKFPLKFVTRQKTFRNICAVITHYIAPNLLLLPIRGDGWKLLFERIFECVRYAAYDDVRIEWDLTLSALYVTWSDYWLQKNLVWRGFASSWHHLSSFSCKEKRQSDYNSPL